MDKHRNPGRAIAGRPLGWLAALALLAGGISGAAAADLAAGVPAAVVTLPDLGGGGGADAAAAPDGLRSLAAEAMLLRALRAPDARALVGASLQGEVGGSVGKSDEREVLRPAGRGRTLPFLMSLVVPGSGEIYLGHELRGIPLVALDVAGWIGVKHYHDRGVDLKNQYYAYADAHWSEQRLEDAFGDPIEEHSGSYYFPDVAQDTLGVYHTNLPLWVSKEADRREYYENLGKWDQFIFGWDDFIDPREFLEPDPASGYIPALQDPRASLHRQEYRRLRNESNDSFTKRDRCLYVNMATRVFSLFQVAWLQGFLGGSSRSPLQVAGHPVRLVAEPYGWHTSVVGVTVGY